VIAIETYENPKFDVSRPFLHSYKTIIQPQFLYAALIIYPINRKDRISFEYVKTYAASPICDKHTELYEDSLSAASLDPI
jgi:hypothetical protein